MRRAAHKHAFERYESPQLSPPNTNIIIHVTLPERAPIPTLISRSLPLPPYKDSCDFPRDVTLEAKTMLGVNLEHVLI